jgi:hypothetical protein
MHRTRVFVALYAGNTVARSRLIGATAAPKVCAFVRAHILSNSSASIPSPNPRKRRHATARQDGAQPRGDQQ